MKMTKVMPDECIISYDVKALFTSVTTEPAIHIIKQHLGNDKELHQRTSMLMQHTIKLLEFCLKNTHFVFQGRFYEQTEGAAMGSPLSPIIAKLYMEAFEEKLSTHHQHPLVCGEDLLMTLLSISRKLRRKVSSAISTP